MKKLMKFALGVCCVVPGASASQPELVANRDVLLCGSER